LIFHIVSKQDWQNALRAGSHEPPSVKSEGFVHCSTRGQTTDTANRFFRGRRDLVLLCIEPERLGAQLRFERPADVSDARAGELFPHVYGPINLDAVVQAVEFPCVADGTFRLPDAV
jgi:uncharacterized protein (DUF952 family)